MRKITVILSLLVSAGLSAQVTDSLELAMPACNTVQGLLLGTVSGVDVSSETGSAISEVSTLIRGVNSLKTSSSPLWIVDGVYLNPQSEVDNPFWEFGDATYTAPQNSLLGINVYDIESIQVLKDVSATSLYGSLGANGVVIINTKYPTKQLPLGLKLNSNMDIAINSGLSATISHNHTLSVSGYRNNTNYYISGFFRNTNKYDANGNMGGFRFNFRSKANAVVQLGMNASLSIGNDSALNPMLSADADIDDNAKEYRTTDGFYLQINPLRSLSIKIEAGMDYRVKRRYLWYGTSTDLGAASNGACAVSSFSQFGMNTGLTVSYNRYFGKHHLKVEGKGEAIISNPQYKVMCGYDFFDYTLRSKGISIASSTSTNRDNGWNGTTFGGYLFADYDYDSKVGANVSVRADYNNLVDTKAVFYPSANAYVDFAKIFLIDPKVMTKARLTAGWGRAGKDNYVPYLWLGNYAQNVPEIDMNYQAFYNGFFRSVSEEFNVGAEFSFLSNRLSLAAKYYSKNTSETLSVFVKGREFGDFGHWVFTDPTEFYTENGSLSNNGIELDIFAAVMRRSRFSWDITFNGSYNINKVQSIPALDNGINPVCQRWTNSNAVSLPAHYIVGYTLDADGHTIYDRTCDGKITEADITGLGSIYPKFVFGLSTTLRFGRFAFEALLSGRLGSKWLDIAAIFEADRKTGTQTLVTTDYLRSGDSVRPTRATLSYDIPFGKKASDIIGLKVNLSAANPLPCFGYTAFPKTSSVIAGICLTF